MYSQRPKSWFGPIPMVRDPVFMDLREKTFDETMLL
jgi:hypothetical protein